MRGAVGVLRRHARGSRSLSDTTVRCAFLGAGDISTLHAAGVASPAVDAELVGLWSRPGCPVVADPAAVAARYGCRLYASPEALIDDPTTDAVFVLTNMETHADYAVAAMDAGKHVLVEKPVAATVAALRAMRAAAERNGVVCMPGHNYIYEPWFARTRELVDAGRLGTVVACYVCYNIRHPEEVMRRSSMQGVIRQILTHHAYMTVFLMGAPLEVSAFSSTVDSGVPKENLVMANLRMANGGLAHLEANFAADDHGADPWSCYVKVIGTEGSARYSRAAAVFSRVAVPRRVHARYNDHVVNAPHIVHSHSYVPYPFTIRAEDAHFVDCVRGTASPLSTIDDAITCQKLVDAVEASIAEGRHVAIDPHC